MLRCSTPFGIRDSTQRGEDRPWKFIYRAQRLSASEIRHAIICLALGGFLGVLNAFRHQRFDTSGLQFFLKNRSRVLNAFRHQRFDTIFVLAIPYNLGNVLNAFRHQRFNTDGSLGVTSQSVRAQRLSASEIQHSTDPTNSVLLF